MEYGKENSVKKLLENKTIVILAISIFIMIIGVIKENELVTFLGALGIVASEVIERIIEVVNAKKEFNENNLLKKEKLYEKRSTGELVRCINILILAALFIINNEMKAGEIYSLNSNVIMFLLVALVLVTVHIYRLIKLKNIVYDDGIFIGKYIKYNKIEKVEVATSKLSKDKLFYITYDNKLHLLKCDNEYYDNLKRLIEKKSRLRIKIK
ncbi:MAG: hypothetical protein KIB43_04065 [Clostridium baratii]|uniref:Uncharacterized protein n=1 Tax=Clostridium baratii str. Sullivan TaxID=1415775 RepID=A0A0A7FVN2_9CLOT|nr:hypothetical protein [Clostridium baratii]AIY83677.1 hypothetical protein U729_2360 [Clostridium baratii str. Sullivan]MBS6006111.1 hypothetical protein [Clostridium baratii]MDU1053183.1 hypothetical protein [Clostridium baratii]MDU4911288.1 hypothetical protein [Clostridium baratii]CUP12658.1 Uncharacterised protein [Clostridium baratii]